MLRRKIGRTDIEISALGMGCWAIGGPFHSDRESALGWGEVDDDESLRTINRALDKGIDFFDTADIYGAGHSERIVARALSNKRQKVVIATKFGYVFNEEHRLITGESARPDYIRRACEASLKRLNTDYIDLYQFHINEYPMEQAIEVRDTLEELVAQGKIRYYAWSTDSPERAALFAAGPHCAAVQHQINVLADAPKMLELCEKRQLSSINRGPLAMGLLTGKYDSTSKISQDDVRGENAPPWMEFFKKGRPNQEMLDNLAAIREVLTSQGRSLAQGALGWLWARSPQTIPIPGCRTVAQAEDNGSALEAGPLEPEQMSQIEGLLER